MVGQRIPACRGQDPDLTHTAAVPLAPHPRLRHGSSAADEDRADRGTEALGQAHAHGVELGTEVGKRGARRDVGVTEGGPVEMHRDPERGRLPAQPMYGVEWLDGAAAEVVGVLDDDESGLHLVRPAADRDELERRVRLQSAAVAAPRARRDPGERRSRTELGPHDMGVGVGEELPTGGDVQAQSELVGHASGRGEQRRLVAEQAGHLLLQGTHRRVLAEDVVAHGGRRHGDPHTLGRCREGVGEQVCAVCGHARLTSRAGCSASRRRGTPARGSAGGSAAGRRPTRNACSGRRRGSSRPRRCTR